MASRFSGLSTLRAQEKKEVPQSEKAKALQAYLVRAGPCASASSQPPLPPAACCLPG